ncbi:amidase family protein [Paraburkholderia tropica]|uniref:amidase family protein n=1 Tax=Paraburkholderia tropica TaxID=92647 RepID=UPI002AB1416C|nr:amidase family protein [Paraburkholderia tropica]
MESYAPHAEIAARIRAIGADVGLEFTARELRDCIELLAELTKAHKSARRIGQNAPMLSPRGREFIVPRTADNRNNAWHVKCELTSQASGPLAGQRVVIDDSVAIATLPMRVGTDMFRGHYPYFDAQVVTRILDAGAVIAGKSNCEYLRLGYGSHTSIGGPVRNPSSSQHIAGGPASGAAAIVASGEAEMAVGVGSILVPAALCGLVAVKPTNGLIPTDGVCLLGAAWDHVGPIAREVNSASRLLSVLMGVGPEQIEREHKGGRRRDGGDKRLRVGFLRESTRAGPSFDGRVSALVRKAAFALRRADLDVADVSLPLHRHIAAIRRAGGLTALGSRLSLSKAVLGALCGFPSGFDASFEQRVALDAAPTSLKLALAIDAYVRRAVSGSHTWVEVAANRLRSGYNELLQECDVLMLPTVPSTAPRQVLAGTEATCFDDRFEYLGSNCGGIDLTGHPAITVPCGAIDGLPVGVMFVGRHYDEKTLIRIASVLEKQEKHARYLEL